MMEAVTETLREAIKGGIAEFNAHQTFLGRYELSPLEVGGLASYLESSITRRLTQVLNNEISAADSLTEELKTVDRLYSIIKALVKTYNGSIALSESEIGSVEDDYLAITEEPFGIRLTLTDENGDPLYSQE